MMVNDDVFHQLTCMVWYRRFSSSLTSREDYCTMKDFSFVQKPLSSLPPGRLVVSGRHRRHLPASTWAL
jgi:hypothetical protein